jgi:cytochrome c oxidase subunit 1
MAQVAEPTQNIEAPAAHEHEKTPLREYFSFSTDHKVIGLQYLVTTLYSI